MTIDPRILKAVAVKPEGVCRGCGYDLRGLPAGAVCPECGRECGPRRRKAVRFADDQLAHAPPEWLRWFAIGAWALVAAGALGAVAAPAGWLVSQAARPLLIVLAGFGWGAGVLMVTRPRPTMGTREGSPWREWRTARGVARGTLWAWPLAGVLEAAGVLAWQPGVALAAIGLIGAALTAVYLARLADWAGDDSLGRSLRSCVVLMAPAMVIAGLLGWAAATSTNATGGSIGLIVMASGLFLVPVAWCLWFALCLVRTAVLASWAVRGKGLTEARRQRLLHGNAREARQCEYCGYDLIGLAYPTRCPECGELEVEGRPPRFAEAPKVDDSPIPLAED